MGSCSSRRARAGRRGRRSLPQLLLRSFAALPAGGTCRRRGKGTLASASSSAALGQPEPHAAAAAAAREPGEEGCGALGEAGSSASSPLPSWWPWSVAPRGRSSGWRGGGRGRGKEGCASLRKRTDQSFPTTSVPSSLLLLRCLCLLSTSFSSPFVVPAGPSRYFTFLIPLPSLPTSLMPSLMSASPASLPAFPQTPSSTV